METTFKKGDRVRLKAWVTGPKFGKGMEHLFPQGCVGIVAYSSPGAVWSKGEPYTALCVPTIPKKYKFLVAVEDLELMPERQVHVVKDGKVYELRNAAESGCCRNCHLLNKSGIGCQYPPAPCLGGFYNYQEVKSGKLVS